MAVKLVLFLIVLAIVLSIAVGATFWYLKHRAEMEHEKDMTETQLEHEERTRLFDE